MTKESTLSEIRLFRSADREHKFTHIIVEGINDIRFFQNKISNRVVLYESFSGKEGVREIVDIFSSNPNIIRVVSAEVQAFTDINADLLNANGHDALAMFHCLCKTPKVADFNEDVILITLILIYNFQDSELYDTLRHYAIVNGLEIIA